MGYTCGYLIELSMGISVDIDGLYLRVFMVFELPKGGNFELSFSGTCKYPPVIHCIGIYLNNTGKIMANV